jgi:hypothetical protein
MNNTGGACDKLAATTKHTLLMTATQDVKASRNEISDSLK